RERPCRGRALDRQQRRRRLSQAADRGGGGEELERSRVRSATSAGGPACAAQRRRFLLRCTPPTQPDLLYLPVILASGEPHEASRLDQASRRRGGCVAARGARAARWPDATQRGVDVHCCGRSRITPSYRGIRARIISFSSRRIMTLSL